jgi:hypothetical protein
MLQATIGSDYDLGRDSLGRWVLNGVTLTNGVLFESQESGGPGGNCGHVTACLPYATCNPNVCNWNPANVPSLSCFLDPTVAITRIAKCGDWSPGNNHWQNPMTYRFQVIQTNSLFDWNKRGCATNANEQYYVYPVAGGTTISLASLNAIAPVNRFCIGLPARVVNANNNVTGENAQIYYDLLTKGSVIVPASTAYLLAWVTDQSTQAFKCPANFGYLASDNACVPVNDLAIGCPIGSVQATKNGIVECVIQASVYCPDGTNYNGTVCVAPSVIDCKTMYGQTSQYEVIEGNGVCVTFPPANPDCSKFGWSAFYEAFSDTCRYTPQSQADCSSSGGVFDSSSGMCIVRPPVVMDCAKYGVGAFFNGTVCISSPQYFQPAVAYDCSALGSSARYNGTNCVVTPEFAMGTMESLLSSMPPLTIFWAIILLIIVLGGFMWLRSK